MVPRASGGGALRGGAERWSSTAAALRALADYRTRLPSMRSTSDFGGAGASTSPRHEAPLPGPAREYTELREVELAFMAAYPATWPLDGWPGYALTGEACREVLVLRVVGELRRAETGAAKVAQASKDGSGRRGDGPGEWLVPIVDGRGEPALHDDGEPMRFVAREAWAGTKASGHRLVADAAQLARDICKARGWGPRMDDDGVDEWPVTERTVAAIVRHGVNAMTDSLAPRGLVPPRRGKERDEMATSKLALRQARDPDRLNGWKEIGRFLGVSAKTAMRWSREKPDGLPVHRTISDWPWSRKSEIKAWEQRRNARGGQARTG